MELRHLRYFVAVAEEGSLTNAAERRLHTAQPSLSRQIRDLERELGVQLLERRARGITLTAAGRVFLDHARLVLLQVEAAGEAARRAGRPGALRFVVGFLTGEEVVWLPQTLRILREEEPGVEITLSSHSSPELARALIGGKVDMAFLRQESGAVGLAFKYLVSEPLVAVLPAGHRLAARKRVRPEDMARETYISAGQAAPVLQAAIDAYAKRNGIALRQEHEADNLTAGISLITSTGGVTLLPDYVRNVLPASVVTRPLHGEPPAVDLMLGYRRSNSSPLLKRFLARLDELVANVSRGRAIGAVATAPRARPRAPA